MSNTVTIAVKLPEMTMRQLLEFEKQCINWGIFGKTITELHQGHQKWFIVDDVDLDIIANVNKDIREFARNVKEMV
jgi:hypothetical protein